MELTKEEIKFLLSALDILVRNNGLQVSGEAYSLGVKLQGYHDSIDKPKEGKKEPKEE